nr:hypothetical protein [uncultured Sphingomonas sp.]
MLAPALHMALAATLQAPAPPPAVQARAQTQVMVQIIQAAEVRGGRSDTPHQRSVRRDDVSGETLILLQFE